MCFGGWEGVENVNLYCRVSMDDPCTTGFSDPAGTGPGGNLQKKLSSVFFSHRSMLEKNRMGPKVFTIKSDCAIYNNIFYEKVAKRLCKQFSILI